MIVYKNINIIKVSSYYSLIRYSLSSGIPLVIMTSVPIVSEQGDGTGFFILNEKQVYYSIDVALFSSVFRSDRKYTYGQFYQEVHEIVKSLGNNKDLKGNIIDLYFYHCYYFLHRYGFVDGLSKIDNVFSSDDAIISLMSILLNINIALFELTLVDEDEDPSDLSQYCAPSLKKYYWNESSEYIVIAKIKDSMSYYWCVNDEGASLFKREELENRYSLEDVKVFSIDISDREHLNEFISNDTIFSGIINAADLIRKSIVLKSHTRELVEAVYQRLDTIRSIKMGNA